MLISARKKDETSKLIVHTIARTNELNVYIFEVQVIDERVVCEDQFTARSSRNVDFEYSLGNTFPNDLARYLQY